MLLGRKQRILCYVKGKYTHTNRHARIGQIPKWKKRIHRHPWALWLNPINGNMILILFCSARFQYCIFTSIRFPKCKRIIFRIIALTLDGKIQMNGKRITCPWTIYTQKQQKRGRARQRHNTQHSENQCDATKCFNRHKTTVANSHLCRSFGVFFLVFFFFSV